MRLMARAVHSSMILNVNVPDVPYEHLRGFRVTRLGHRHRVGVAWWRATDPHGRAVYWVGPAGEGADAGRGHRLRGNRGRLRLDHALLQ